MSEGLEGSEGGYPGLQDDIKTQCDLQLHELAATQKGERAQLLITQEKQLQTLAATLQQQQAETPPENLEDLASASQSNIAALRRDHGLQLEAMVKAQAPVRAAMVAEHKATMKTIKTAGDGSSEGGQKKQ
jgi:hypothetical protein